jgi:glycerol kinase
MQFQADIADVAVERPTDVESTGRGAAMLAGVGSGLFGSLDEVAKMVSFPRRFQASMSPSDRAAHLARWNEAVRRTLTLEPGAKPVYLG